MQKAVARVIDDYLKTKSGLKVIRAMISKARYDLYYGPIPAEEQTPDLSFERPYPGFSRAIDEIREAINDLDTLYVDTDAETWQTSEPTGFADADGEWVEPDHECIVQVEPELIRQRLLGSELARYV